MYPELKHFNQVSEEYDAKLSRLYEKKEQIQLKKTQMKQKKEYNALVKKIDEKIAEVKTSKKQRLQELIPFLLEGKEREVSAAEKKFSQMKNELLRFRVQYLLLIQQLYEIQQYAEQIDSIFKSSIDSIDSPFQPPDLNQEQLDVNLHDPNHPNQLPVGIMEKEVLQVYQTGQLPQWITSYIANLNSTMEQSDKPITIKNKRLND